MNETNRRGRGPAPAQQAGSGQPSTRSNRYAHTGDDLEASEAAEAARQAQQAERRSKGIDRVFRHWMKQGETREVIFLDDEVKDGFQIYEHDIKENGKFGNHYTCVKESAVCPACAAEGESYWVVMFSVLVVDAYVDKKTGEKRNSRNLMAIKYHQWTDLKKILLAAQKRNGGKLRGVSLTMKRDLGPATQSPAIGKPQIDTETGDMFYIYTEDELDEFFGNDAVVGREKGVILKAENADITPLPYLDIFPEPDLSALRERFGSDVKGSAEDVAKGWAADGDDDIDMAPRAGRRRAAEAAPATRRRSRTAPPADAGGETPEAEEEVPFDDGEEAPTPTARPRRGAGDTPPPASTAVAGRRSRRPTR